MAGDVTPRRLSPDLRYRIMSSIRSRGNSSTEATLCRLLREYRITGWRRHLRLPGTPDFVFRKQRLVVFVDGDFWHGNPSCFRPPTSNPQYWGPKIARNKARDERTTRELRERGWAVLRLWESELKDKPATCIERIEKHLKTQPAMPQNPTQAGSPPA
jgi:DNA mismatch endonuclease (patch repair protein)